MSLASGTRCWGRPESRQPRPGGSLPPCSQWALGPRYSRKVHRNSALCVLTLRLCWISGMFCSYGMDPLRPGPFLISSIWINGKRKSVTSVSKSISGLPSLVLWRKRDSLLKTEAILARTNGEQTVLVQGSSTQSYGAVFFHPTQFLQSKPGSQVADVYLVDICLFCF